MKMPSTVLPSLFLTFPLTITIPRLRSPSGRMNERGGGGGRGERGGGKGRGERERRKGEEGDRKRNERREDIRGEEGRDKESIIIPNGGELRPARLMVNPFMFSQ